MTTAEYEAKLILACVKGADGSLQMIRDIYPETADLLALAFNNLNAIREILSWRADDTAPAAGEVIP